MRWLAEGIGLSLLGIVSLAGCGEPGAPPTDKVWSELTVCPGEEIVRGVDVADYQGAIDWDTVASSGIAFAFVRVGDGIANPDETFDFNWPEVKRVGIIRGVYQYFRAGDDPVVQANLLLQKTGALGPGDLPPVADVENTDGQSAAVISEQLGIWVKTIEEATGKTPIIYTGSFWNTYVHSNAFVDNPLWVAHWYVTCPSLPEPWTTFAFQQDSASGSVPGIPTGVDLDLWNGDLASLEEFASVTAACGDGKCNGDETPDTCPGDCPRCEPVPPEGRVVDEREICFERGGPAAYWREETAGHGDTLLWNHTTDNPEPANYGIWHLELAEAGDYVLEAYTPAPWSQSRQAPYQVHHGGATDVVQIDQTARDGWALIGTYPFAAGGEQWIRLDDNTGEPNADDVQLVFDAIRLTRQEAEPDGGPDGDAGPDETIDAGPDAGPDTDAGADPGVDNGKIVTGSGCGCDQASSGPTGYLHLLVLLCLMISRQRREAGGRERGKPYGRSEETPM